MYGLWFVLSLVWLQQDHLIRDGDEEGHVGAMELCKELVAEQGWLAWISNMFWGNMGEYPPVFASLYGAIWYIMEQCVQHPIEPNQLILRMWLLLCPITAMIAVGQIAKHLSLSKNVAKIVCLYLPLLNGVSRHYMPENLVLVWTVLSILFAIRASTTNKTLDYSILGIFLALGLLSKQTFVIVAFVSVAWMFYIHRGTWTWWKMILMLLLCLSITTPWYLQSLSAQAQYIRSSVGSNIEISVWTQILFYPSVILFLGTLWIFPLGIFTYWKNRHVSNTAFPKELLGWIISLVILMGIPKQYPRMLLPYVPLIALGFAYLYHRAKESQLWVLYAVCMTNLYLCSFYTPSTEVFYTHIYDTIDDRCPQRWLRPPYRDDFHLRDLLQFAQKHPDPIVIVTDMNIPCSIQSTHSWSYHVAPYLRRNGIDRDVFNTNDISHIYSAHYIRVAWDESPETFPPNFHLSLAPTIAP